MPEPTVQPKCSPKRSNWGPGVLLAAPFFVLSGVPWLSAPGEHTMAFSLTLLAVAAALAYGARPRRHGMTEVLPSAGEPGLVRLTHCPSADGSGDALYAVEHVNARARTVLARGENPVSVLEQGMRYARRAGTTLRRGWGLGGGDVDALGAMSNTNSTSRRLPTMSLQAPRRPGSRSATVTLLLVSLVVLTVVLTGAHVQTSEVSLTSTLLAGVAVALPLGLAVLTASTTQVELVDNRMEFYRAGLVWRRLEARFAADEVLHICAVAPNGRFHKHLLLRTVFGLRCIECAEAQRVARAVHEGWKHTGGRPSK